MEKERIQLRGHHLGTFAVKYWGDDFYNHSPEELFSTSSVDKRKILSDSSQGTYLSIYGVTMKNSVDAVYNLLQMRPDLEVEIVKGLDSICKGG